MVVPNRELVNITLSSKIYNSFNPIIQNNSSIDIDIDIYKGRSASLSTNNSRELLTHSNCSSILYHKRIEDISNKLSWNKQVKLNEKKNFFLSYTISKIGENRMANEDTDQSSKDGEQSTINKTTVPNNTIILQDRGVDNINRNTSIPYGLEMSSIPYGNYQPAELNS